MMLWGAALAAAAALVPGGTEETAKEQVDERLQYARGRVKALMRHVFTNHKTEWPARNALRKLKKVVIRNGDGSLAASFSWKTGRLTVFRDDKPWNAKTKARLNFSLLHELAHTSGKAHDATWRSAYLWFMKVATEELNWTVVVPWCSKCANYGLCSRKLCPKCRWEYEPQTCPQPPVAGHWIQENCNTPSACRQNGATQPPGMCKSGYGNSWKTACKGQKTGDAMPTGRWLPEERADSGRGRGKTGGEPGKNRRHM